MRKIRQLVEVALLHLAAGERDLVEHRGQRPRHGASSCAAAMFRFTTRPQSAATTIRASRSSDRAPLSGSITDGVFRGGPGRLLLELALGHERLQLDLIGACMQASGMTETGIDDLLIVGAIPKADVDARVIPALHAEMLAQLASIIAADCPGTAPPDCGCASGSLGRTLIDQLDTMPADCEVSLTEVQRASMLPSSLRPDVTIDGEPALSFGFAVRAVPAIF